MDMYFRKVWVGKTKNKMEKRNTLEKYKFQIRRAHKFILK